MENTVYDGIIAIDGTGDIVSSAVRLMITGIQVKASNATWAITLKDIAGKTVFDANNTVGIVGTISKPFPSNGLTCATLTNCTALVYIEP